MFLSPRTNPPTLAPPQLVCSPQIFKLDYGNPSTDMPLAGGAVAANERFHRLVWGPAGSETEGCPHGLIAGGLVDGRGLHSLTSELNLRTFGITSLTLELNLSTFGTPPRVNLGYMGHKVSLR